MDEYVMEVQERSALSDAPVAFLHLRVIARKKYEVLGIPSDEANGNYLLI